MAETTAFNYEYKVKPETESVEVWADPDYPITLSVFDLVRMLGQVEPPIGIDDPEKWQQLRDSARELMPNPI